MTRTVIVRVNGIEIIGPDDFVNVTNRALTILFRRSPSFASVSKYLRRIVLAKRSGMHVYTKTFREGRKGAHTCSAVWYASCIAHEAYHSYLYYNAKKRCADGEEPNIEKWAGVYGETECLIFQIQVLKEISPEDEHLVKYLIDLIWEDPKYQGNPNSWIDYWRRNW